MITQEVIIHLRKILGCGEGVGMQSIFENVRNAVRRSHCLSRIEDHYTTRIPPASPDEAAYEECPLPWGAEPEEYYRAYLKAIQNAIPPLAEMKAYRQACEAAYHDYYKTGDKDTPEEICNRNGEVVLSQCRVCGQAEAELEVTCPGPKKPKGPVPTENPAWGGLVRRIPAAPSIGEAIDAIDRLEVRYNLDDSYNLAVVKKFLARPDIRWVPTFQK